MAEKRPDAMDVLISAITELGRAPDPEVLRLIAERRERPHDPNPAGLPIARPEKN
jgi:hypothetical protein